MKGLKPKTLRRRKTSRRKSLKRRTYKRGGKAPTRIPPKPVIVEPVGRITAIEVLPDDLAERLPPGHERPRDVIGRNLELEGMRQRISAPINNDEMSELFEGFQMRTPPPPTPPPPAQDLDDEYEMYDFVDMSGGRRRRRK